MSTTVDDGKTATCPDEVHAPSEKTSNLDVTTAAKTLESTFSSSPNGKLPMICKHLWIKSGFEILCTYV